MPCWANVLHGRQRSGRQNYCHEAHFEYYNFDAAMLMIELLKGYAVFNLGPINNAWAQITGCLRGLRQCDMPAGKFVGCLGYHEAVVRKCLKQSCTV